MLFVPLSHRIAGPIVHTHTHIHTGTDGFRSWQASPLRHGRGNMKAERKAERLHTAVKQNVKGRQGKSME